MHSVTESHEQARTMMNPEHECEECDAREDRETQTAVRELMALLPADVLGDIRRGAIDSHDPAFLSGLMDHASRLSLADPQNGRRELGKIIRLRKLLHRNLRDAEPGIAVSPTVMNVRNRVGRNTTCPCGSGRKSKQNCTRKV